MATARFWGRGRQAQQDLLNHWRYSPYVYFTVNPFLPGSSGTARGQQEWLRRARADTRAAAAPRPGHSHQPTLGTSPTRKTQGFSFSFQIPRLGGNPGESTDLGPEGAAQSFTCSFFDHLLISCSQHTSHR